MRKFKTAADNRTNYIYYFDDGSKCVITPGEDGENTTIIAQLHAMDDEQLDADRREDYHCPVHYQAYSDGEGEDADDRNPYLCDTASDPLEQMLSMNQNYKTLWFEPLTWHLVKRIPCTMSCSEM